MFPTGLYMRRDAARGVFALPCRIGATLVEWRRAPQTSQPFKSPLPGGRISCVVLFPI